MSWESKPKSEIALSEICAEAEKLGMSYGEYVAYCSKNENRKEEKPMGPMNQAELRTAMIKDYNEGMNYKEIAERYQVNPHTVRANFFNWSKKGWVTLRTKMEKPVHKPKAEEQSEPKIKFDTALDILHVLTSFARGVLAEGVEKFAITGVYACCETETSEVELNLDDKRYILQMKRAEE